MRRSTLDVRLGRALRIGQQWRDRDDVIWRVRQVHRIDCDVVLVRAGLRRTVSFAHLRRDFVLIAHTLEEAA